jgi:dihydroorotase
MDIDSADFGTIGLESFFGALLSVFDLNTTIKILTSGKTIFNILDYKIEEGSTANLSLFIVDDEYEFSKENILSKSKNSAFLGFKMQGRPIGIINSNKTCINE